MKMASANVSSAEYDDFLLKKFGESIVESVNRLCPSGNPLRITRLKPGEIPVLRTRKEVLAEMAARDDKTAEEEKKKQEEKWTGDREHQLKEDSSRSRSRSRSPSASTSAN